MVQGCGHRPLCLDSHSQYRHRVIIQCDMDTSPGSSPPQNCDIIPQTRSWTAEAKMISSQSRDVCFPGGISLLTRQKGQLSTDGKQQPASVAYTTDNDTLAARRNTVELQLLIRVSETLSNVLPL